MTITIEEVVATIPDWQGRNAVIRPLSGGLTNTNFRVEVDGTAYFVRIPGESTELLAIDRRNEYHNSRAAAEAGVGPKVLYHLAEHDVMVLEFINGVTMSNERLNAPGMPSAHRPVTPPAAQRAALPHRFQHVSPDRVLPGHLQAAQF